MDKVHELIEQLGKEIFNLFPNGTKASVNIESNGYIYLSVEKWQLKSNIPVKDCPRRELLDQSKYGGKWQEDRSAWQNDYYKKCGCLLEED